MYNLFEGCLSTPSSLRVGVLCRDHSSTAITTPFLKYARPKEHHGKTQAELCVPQFFLI
jgi:hypothetical protein